MPTTNAERTMKWRNAHREESREYMREYMRKLRLDPEYRERHNALLRKRYAENIEYHRERSLKWAKDNPEKACDQARRYRARKIGAAGDFTPDQVSALCESRGHRCFYCNQKRKLEAEHRVPLCRGGSNDISNIVPACKSCNSRKGRLTAEEYLARKETSNWPY
jgi:5-methylcytosine-specific restriction endonuclease McrA